jgi:hypothetical protein
VFNKGASSTEITLKSALRTLFTDPSLSDVNLEGTDGLMVHANRCILAARSQVFRDMLFGDCLEADNNAVRLGYDSEILKSVVEYCLTDDAELIRLEADKACDAKRARKVVELARAANYFDLPKLKCKVESWAYSQMGANASLACYFLDEARASFDSSTECIDEFAWKIIQSQPSEALFKDDAVTAVSQLVLESILKDGEIKATELTLFRALVLWTNANSHLDKLHASSLHEKHQRVAEDMTKHLLLEKISPVNLLKIVEPSGLVTTDQLLQAYRSQAIMLEPQTPNIFKRMRHNKSANWQSSGNDVINCITASHSVDLLQRDMVIRSGKCKKWMIKVEVDCEFIWIGVASTAHEISHSKWLGKQAGGWVYGSNGSACHATGLNNGPYTAEFQTFSCGTEITMNLDLRGSGTLEATVAGKSFILFSNMLDAFGEDEEVGFLPAISLTKPGKVRFIGFLPDV